MPKPHRRPRKNQKMRKNNGLKSERKQRDRRSRIDSGGLLLRVSLSATQSASDRRLF
jgi:hypothetical protein